MDVATLAGELRPVVEMLVKMKLHPSTAGGDDGAERSASEDDVGMVLPGLASGAGIDGSQLAPDPVLMGCGQGLYAVGNPLPLLRRWRYVAVTGLAQLINSIHASGAWMALHRPGRKTTMKSPRFLAFGRWAESRERVALDLLDLYAQIGVDSLWRGCASSTRHASALIPTTGARPAMSDSCAPLPGSTAQGRAKDGRRQGPSCRSGRVVHARPGASASARYPRESARPLP